jgi:hypothetical protein
LPVYLFNPDQPAINFISPGKIYVHLWLEEHGYSSREVGGSGHCETIQMYDAPEAREGNSFFANTQSCLAQVMVTFVEI